MKDIVIRDGLKLVIDYEYVKDPIVILSHGFMGDMGYSQTSSFVLLKKRLNEIGFSTLRFDFNGHGKSDGKQEDMTVLNEISDLFKMIEYVQNKGHKRIFLLGHSQGGVVSSMCAGYMKDKIEGLIIMSAAAALKDDAIHGTCMGIQYDPYHVPNTVNLHGFYTLGNAYIRTAQLLPIYEVASQFEGPVCIIHGLEDEVVDYKYSEKYHSIYKNSELHLIEGENHNLKNHTDLCFDYVIHFLKPFIK